MATEVFTNAFLSAGTQFSREVPMLNGNAALLVTADMIEVSGTATADVYVQGSNDLDAWRYFNAGGFQDNPPTGGTGNESKLMMLTAAAPQKGAAVGADSGATGTTTSFYNKNFNAAYVRLAVVVTGTSPQIRIHAVVNPTGG